VIQQQGADTRALEALDTEACVRLAQELTRIPSVTGDERAAQDHVAAALTAAGLEVERFEADLARLKAHPRFPGMEVDRQEAVLVAGTLGAKGDRTLILNGHVDVVPPGDRQPWLASPWSGHVHAGRLYGRGAADMKAGLAVGIAAAAALKKSGLPLRGRLIVHSVVGEEDGGIGTFAMLDRGYRADAAIILEPTRLRIIPAQAGALSFRLRIPGRAAHASVRYEGVSAIDKFEVVQARLRQLERSLNVSPHELFRRYPIPYALSIGRLRAGSWSAMVPDDLQAEGRVGVPIAMRGSPKTRLAWNGLADSSTPPRSTRTCQPLSACETPMPRSSGSPRNWTGPRTGRTCACTSMKERSRRSSTGRATSARRTRPTRASPSPRSCKPHAS